MIVSAAINSTSGLIVRNLESATDWQIVLWRGLALGITITAIDFAQHGKAAVGEFCRLGWLGILAGLLYGGTIVGFTLALTRTSVANAVFIMSAIPFFTAIASWFVLRERLSQVTLLGMVASFAGIALMLVDGLNRGSIFGNFMAITAALCFAYFVVILRKKRTTNMLPSMVVGALISVFMALLFLGGDYQVSIHDLSLCVLWGAVISAISHFLVLICSRQLAGAELTLLIIAEFALAPIWVWIFVNEIPGRMTILGGVIVLLAVGSQSILAGQKTNSNTS